MPKQVRWDRSRFSPRPKSQVTAQAGSHAQTHPYTPREARVWLGRWEADRLVAEACQLRRISQRGAIVLLESHLPEGKAVWVSLHGHGERLGSVPARVAKSSVIAPGAVLVWLKFGVPCPGDLLYAAVFGPDVLEATLN